MFSWFSQCPVLYSPHLRPTVFTCTDQAALDREKMRSVEGGGRTTRECLRKDLGEEETQTQGGSALPAEGK